MEMMRKMTKKERQTVRKQTKINLEKLAFSHE